MAGSSLIGNLAVLLSMDTSAFEEGATRAQRLLQRTQRQMAQVGDRISTLGRQMTVGLTLPIVALGTHAARTAIAAEELQSAFNVSFGEMARSARGWAEQVGDRLGRSTTEMQEMALRLHGLFRAGGPATEQTRRLAQQFAILAQDLSSFENVDPSEALQRLVSGLSGEAEPMRRFSVFLTETAVRAEALRLGLIDTSGELSEQSKIMARASLIMRGTTDAQGDVLRTSENTANQIRRAQAAWQELSVTIGTKIIPLITPLVERLGRMLEWFTRLSPEVQNFAIGAMAVAAALGPVLIAVGSLVTLSSQLLPLIAGLTGGAGLAGLLGILGPLGVAAGVVVIAFRNWSEITGLVQNVTTRVRDMSEATRQLEDRARSTRGAFDQFASAEAFQTHFWQTLEDDLVGIGRRFNELDQDLRGVQEWAERSDAAIAEWARNAWQSFEQFWERTKAGFRNMVQEIGRWMGDRLNSIWAGVRERIEQVGSWFQGLYTAVVGNSYIPDMVDEIGEHMRRLEQEMVQPAQTAAERTEAAFAGLRDTLAELFPDEREFAAYQARVAQIERGVAAASISPALGEEAIRRAREAWLSNRQEARGSDLGSDGTFERVFSPEWAAQAQQNLQLVSDRFMRAFGGMSEASRQLGDDIDNVIQNGLRGMMRGFTSLKDIALEVLFSIGDAIIANLFTRTSGAGGGGAGGIGAAIAQVVGSLFRANGGPVAAGRGYVVGERGPEWFQPRVAGSIIPAGAMSRGGGIVINQTFAPNFAGNAATKEDMVRFAAIVKADTLATVRDNARRRG